MNPTRDRRAVPEASSVPASASPSPGEALAVVDPAVASERVGDGAVLVHLETNQIYELNATASRLFELLRSGASRSEIEATVVAEFDVDRAVLSRELDELLAALRARGIVR